MYYPNQETMQYSAQKKYEAYRQEANQARAVREAYPQRPMMSKVRNFMARMMHRMADVVAADKPISAYDRA